MPSNSLLCAWMRAGILIPLLLAGNAGAESKDPVISAFEAGTICTSDLADVAANCPFKYGIASGDPLHDRVILWTAIDEDLIDSTEMEVGYRVATDPGFNNTIATGVLPISPDSAFTIKLDQAGLGADTFYYYQFSYGGFNTVVGRTRTLPLPNAATDRVKLAVASCSNMPAGYFNAYGRIADHDDLNAVLHLGDYYYEYGPGEYADNSANFPERSPAPAHEIVTLGDYRLRHQQYKSDADSQRMHARHPLIAVWDDHESANDSYQTGAENHNPENGEGVWFDRKSTAVSAYYEWMPVREQNSEFNMVQVDGEAFDNEDPVIFRSFRFGQLAELSMLDTRLYNRVGQAPAPEHPDVDSPERTMLGDRQRTWLNTRLSSNDVQWKILGQQVMFGQLMIGGQTINADQWDGYRHERGLIHDFIGNNAIDNVVVLTGDIHTSWAIDITSNPFGVTGPNNSYESLGVEFVTTSVTSPGVEAGDINGISPADEVGGPFLAANNPHIQYADLDSRGYTVLDISTDRVRNIYYQVPIDRQTNEQCTARIFESPTGANRLSEVPFDSSDKCESSGIPGGPGNEQSPELTVVVMVVDSLMPEEIGAVLTPTPELVAFRAAGTAYAESRSVFSAETIPNHVAMMTGAYPETNGIPTNNYWDRQGTPAERDLSLPSELEAKTLFTMIAESCPDTTTAAALSKDYLYEMFTACGFSGNDCGINVAPDQHFDPTSDPTFIPGAGLTPDQTTMREARGFLPNADFLFVNLGDVDRTGHADGLGPTGVPEVRNAVLADTDTLIGQFIQDLKDAGRWESTVMFIVSDHGMDYSTPTNFINVSPLVAPFDIFAIQNGGTDNLYLNEPNDPLGDQKLASARAAVVNLSGVADAWYTEQNPADPGLDKVLPGHLRARHENLGDLVLSAENGFRFSEPTPSGNPIPGNHGHKPTLHSTFIIGGGAPFVKSQMIGDPDAAIEHFIKLERQSENVDVAATLAWLLGMNASAFEGRPLLEAFRAVAAPASCKSLADTDDDGFFDIRDNCTLIDNPSQCDTNGDGFGNQCDADLDNNGGVTQPDLGIFRSQFGMTGSDLDADLNCDGGVTQTDLGMFRSLFDKPPGPSALAE